MRRLLLALALLVVAAAPAHAGPNVCVVTPSPLPAGEVGVGTAFKVEAWNLTPDTSYYLQIEQPGESQYGHHIEDGAVTDSIGYIVLDWLNTYHPPRNVLVAGKTATVKLSPVDNSGVKSSCRVDVV